MLLLHAAHSDRGGMAALAAQAAAAGKYNVAFMALFLLGDVQQCIQVGWAGVGESRRKEQN